jgi:hypothetical protein
MFDSVLKKDLQNKQDLPQTSMHLLRFYHILRASAVAQGNVVMAIGFLNGK